jgi:methyltransferase, FkbM family
MASLVSRAVTVAREEGYLSLAKKTLNYLSGSSRKFRQKARYELWKVSGTHTVSVGGIQAKFHVNDKADYNAITFFEDNEKEMVRDVLDEISKDNTVWDVGANFGLYTCLLQTVPSIDVVAFEPFPENRRRLEKNLELNGLDCKVTDFALSNTDGEVEFGFASGADGSLGGTRIATHNDEEVVSVEMCRGDDLNLPQPSVVKIDVEGAEHDVINGMSETLENCRLLYCEIHHADEGTGSSIQDYGSTLEELMDTVESLGFTTEKIEGKEEPDVR